MSRRRIGGLLHTQLQSFDLRSRLKREDTCLNGREEGGVVQGGRDVHEASARGRIFVGLASGECRQWRWHVAFIGITCVYMQTIHSRLSWPGRRVQLNF